MAQIQISQCGGGRQPAPYDMMVRRTVGDADPYILHFSLGAAVARVGFEVQLLALVGNGGAGWDGLGDKGVGAHDAVVADGGAAA